MSMIFHLTKNILKFIILLKSFKYENNKSNNYNINIKTGGCFHKY